MALHLGNSMALILVLSCHYCTGNVLSSSAPTVVPHIDRRKVPSEPVILNKYSDTVRLDCPSVGRPVPTIKWTRNNRPLTSLTTNNERFDLYLRNLYSNGSLVLRYVHDTSDSGVYTCTATNDVGSDSVNITLISKEEQLRQELEGTILW